jgi:hypothetical protein
MVGLLIEKEQSKGFRPSEKEKTRPFLHHDAGDTGAAEIKACKFLRTDE